MKTELKRYRFFVLSGIGVLVIILAVMVTNLMWQLRALSVAAGDNTLWTISQLDTEFANLDATLTGELVSPDFSETEVRLRLEIALSRLKIINSGRAAAIFEGSDEALALIAPLNAFAADIIADLDRPGPLTREDLRNTQQNVRAIRPDVRAIAVLGVRLSAEQSKERRADFARQLSWTGGVAIALLVLMAALMRFLVRLLDRAKERDQALLTSSKQLAATVAASLDAIVTADDQGRIIAFNASAEQVFGWVEKDILGQKMDDTIIPYHMRDAHRAGMRRYLASGTPRVVDAGRIELAALRKSGEEFPVELNITEAEVAGHKTFIAYVRDISARKINEQTLIDARDRALRMDKAKSRFLTVMSHEIRTPLNGILGVLDLLKTTRLSPDQERYAKIATASSEILLEYVNEALDITRIETGALQFSFQDFDVQRLVFNLVEVLTPLAQEKGLALTLDLDKAMQRRFNGDSHRIRQILMNLIGNAIKFTEQGGIQITVTGIHGPDTSAIRFAVTDTGGGIAEEDQELVFEDFVALAQSAGRQTRGDGLGLSISRRIAREMGGDIALESTVGAGSTFTLSLPLERAETASIETKEATGDLSPSLSPRAILLVEDNDINRKVLRDMLAMMGHDITEAADGLACLEEVARRRFDVIFMDISMPQMGGIEATQAIRSGAGPNARTTIIGLTAHGKEEYRAPAKRAGMDHFYTKPIRLDALRLIFSEMESAVPLGQDTLDELISVLGVDQVGATIETFFVELDRFITDLVRAEVDAATLATAAHRLKGAAALLGQDQLETALAAFEDDAFETPIEKAETLRDLAEGAKASTAQKLSTAKRAGSKG